MAYDSFHGISWYECPDSCMKFPAQFPALHGCSGKKFAVASIFEWRATGVVEKEQAKDIRVKSPLLSRT